MSNDTYAMLAAGDPQALAALGIAPRIVALATAARRQRALAPSLAPSAPRGQAAIAASAIAPASAPRPSRALSVASIHLDSINDSRKRAGLQPLTVTELEHEFSEVDRLPASRTKISRRDAANMMAQRQGVPTTQAAIDAEWSGIVAKLNASLPSSRTPIGARASSAAGGRPSQASIDSMWTALATDLNKSAGLATPARAR